MFKQQFFNCTIINTMNNIKIYNWRTFCTLCFLFMGLQSVAQNQDTIIPTQRIEILQSYKPEITRQEKPELYPSINAVESPNPELKYEVPQQTLSYFYRSVPIKPLALGRQTAAPVFNNYLKVGAGNYTSILADAGFSFKQDNVYNASLHIAHLSQKGGKINRQNANTELGFNGDYQVSDQHKIFSDINIFRRGNTFYGYDESIYNYEKDSIRQVFTGANISIGLENNITEDFYYKPQVSFGYYNDKLLTQETNIGFLLPFRYNVRNAFEAHLGIGGNVTQYKKDTFTTSNNIFQLKPAIKHDFGFGYIHLGVYPTWGKSNIFYVLPDFNINVTLSEGKLGLHGGWKGDLVQNTYKQLTEKNPFLHHIGYITQTKTDQIFGGFETTLIKHLTIGATFSWRQWRHLAMFTNDYSYTADGKYFKTFYENKLEGVSLEGFVNYQVGKKVSITANTTWYGFTYQENYAKLFQEPVIKFGSSVQVIPLKNLDLNVRLDIWDGIYIMDATTAVSKLPTIADLGLSAEYLIIPRLSLFLHANNLLNQQYSRWHQYPVFGINAIGGLRVKF